MSYCPNCGKKIDDCTFCPECGAKLQETAPLQNSSYNVADNQQNTRLLNAYNKNKVRLVFAFAVGVLCLLLGISMNYAIEETKSKAKGISITTGYVMDGEFHTTNDGGTIGAHPELNKQIPLLTFLKYFLLLTSAAGFIYGIRLSVINAKLRKDLNHSSP